MHKSCGNYVPLVKFKTLIRKGFHILLLLRGGAFSLYCQSCLSQTKFFISGKVLSLSIFQGVLQIWFPTNRNSMVLIKSLCILQACPSHCRCHFSIFFLLRITYLLIRDRTLISKAFGKKVFFEHSIWFVFTLALEPDLCESRMLYSL